MTGGVLLGRVCEDVQKRDGFPLRSGGKAPIMEDKKTQNR